MQLRDYQLNICRKLGKAIDSGKRKILLTAPVGAGKTVMFTDFAKKVAKVYLSTLIVTDRFELLKQTCKHSTKDCKFGVLTPSLFKPSVVTVAMLQTLRSRLKQETYQAWLSSFDIIIIDEIHQMINGSTYQRICDFSSDESSIVGISATPWDSKGYLYTATLNGVFVGNNRNYVAKLKRQGLKVGMPDIIIFTNNKSKTSHVLFIEMKRQKGSKVSEVQKEMIQRISDSGYDVGIGWGCESAIRILEKYLET